MAKFFIIIGSLLAAVSVALGAFGAHALKARLAAEQLATFRTGVEYQMVHALAIILIGVLLERQANSLLASAGIVCIAGIFMFSGSLYLLATTTMRWPGPITPLGGLAFMAAWIMVAIAMVNR